MQPPMDPRFGMASNAHPSQPMQPPQPPRTGQWLGQSAPTSTDHRSGAVTPPDVESRLDAVNDPGLQQQQQQQQQQLQPMLQQPQLSAAQPSSRRRVYPAPSLQAQSQPQPASVSTPYGNSAPAYPGSVPMTAPPAGYVPAQMGLQAGYVPLQQPQQQPLQAMSGGYVPAQSGVSPGYGGPAPAGYMPSQQHAISSGYMQPQQQGISPSYGPPQAAGYQPSDGSQANQLANHMGQMALGGSGVVSAAMMGVPLLGLIPAVQEIDKVLPWPLSGSVPCSDSPFSQCPASYFRCSLRAVPQTYALLNKSRLPLGLILHAYKSPSQHEPLPVIGDTDRVDPHQPVYSAASIVRCRRCRTYINPFIQFVDNQHWRCNICYLLNDVPAFFDFDLQTQQYMDRRQRPEVAYGMVEYVAPAEYTVRPPQPPVYVFVIDVSFAAVSSGMVATLAQALKNTLDAIPSDERRTRVAFIAVDSVLHFFRFDLESMEPQMLVVSDLDDIYLPLPMECLLVNLTEFRDSIETFLDRLPSMFAGTQNTANCLGSGLKAAYNLISWIGGKIVVFQASLPSLGEAPLKAREDPKSLGTAAENQLLQPASSMFKSLAIDCSRTQVTVDLFLFGTQYLDVATLCGATRFTAGSLHYYPGFSANRVEDGVKFAKELQHFLSRPLGLEAILRVRCSKGIRVEGFHGNFFVRSSDLLALSTTSPDNAYTFQLTIDETLNLPTACFQAAFLYSTSFGERRIRVMTLALPITSDLNEIYRHIDQVALTNLLCKMAIERALSSKLDDAREAVFNKCVDICSVYKTSFLPSGPGAQLILGDHMKLLPLLFLALMKHVLADIRTFSICLTRVLSSESMMTYLLPRLYELHTMPAEVGQVTGDDGRIAMPTQINLSSERLVRHGIYLMDCFDMLILWLGRAVPPQVIQELFDLPSLEALPTGKYTLPRLDTLLSRKLNNIIEHIRDAQDRRFIYPQLWLAREDGGDPTAKILFLQGLIEDRHEFGPGYGQFLNEIKEKVNKGS